eukprot:scaffold7135_cov96-Isochrysis_galbana.AAC.1
MDESMDASTDASMDRGASVDASTDASMDASTDASTDASIDASTDASMDAPGGEGCLCTPASTPVAAPFPPCSPARSASPLALSASAHSDTSGMGARTAARIAEGGSRWS